ncbi:MAG: 1,6-anhydro-N-acetylmuramyl-L-alanine amidase AmpD [Burkholderiaceae bacterium]
MARSANWHLDDQGWCRAATRVPSPNFDDRPSGVAIELLVIHCISLPPGEFGGPSVLDLFTNRLDWGAHPYFEQIRGLKVSAHFLVRRDGQLIQFVACTKRAWHAGVSHFEGRDRCNDFSIGIELEGIDTLGFEPVQYEVLARVARSLAKAYPLAAAAAHSEIAPGRKSDPGALFEWSRFLESGHVPLRRMRV